MYEHWGGWSGAGAGQLHAGGAPPSTGSNILLIASSKAGHLVAALRTRLLRPPQHCEQSRGGQAGRNYMQLWCRGLGLALVSRGEAIQNNFGLSARVNLWGWFFF